MAGSRTNGDAEPAAATTDRVQGARRLSLTKAVGATVSRFTQDVEKSYQPWAMAVALQLLTVRVAAARGTDPDQLRREDPTYLAARRVYR